MLHFSQGPGCSRQRAGSVIPGSAALGNLVVTFPNSATVVWMPCYCRKTNEELNHRKCNFSCHFHSSQQLSSMPWNLLVLGKDYLQLYPSRSWIWSQVNMTSDLLKHCSMLVTERANPHNRTFLGQCPYRPLEKRQSDRVTLTLIIWLQPVWALPSVNLQRQA